MRPSGNAFISRCSMKTCPSFDENKLYRSIKNIIVDPRSVQLESQQELWNIIRLSCLVFSTEWQNKKWIFYLPFTIQIRSPLPLSSTHFKFQVSTQQRSCHSQSMTFKYNAIVVFVALTWKNFFFFWCFEMPSKVSKVCNKIQPHTPLDTFILSTSIRWQPLSCVKIWWFIDISIVICILHIAHCNFAFEAKRQYRSMMRFIHIKTANKNCQNMIYFVSIFFCSVCSHEKWHFPSMWNIFVVIWLWWYYIVVCAMQTVILARKLNIFYRMDAIRRCFPYRFAIKNAFSGVKKSMAVAQIKTHFTSIHILLSQQYFGMYFIVFEVLFTKYDFIWPNSTCRSKYTSYHNTQHHSKSSGSQS